MKKEQVSDYVIEVNKCDDCPYLQEHYSHYECGKLQIEVENTHEYLNNCPLKGKTLLLNYGK